jgi:hypothetical protein
MPSQQTTRPVARLNFTADLESPPRVDIASGRFLPSNVPFVLGASREHPLKLPLPSAGAR